MTSFIISPAGKQGLHEIALYISKDSPKSTLKILKDIEEKCKMLSEYPHLGHRRPDLTKYPVLFWPVQRYLIVYKEDSKPLEIVRILSGYRNILEIL